MFHSQSTASCVGFVGTLIKSRTKTAQKLVVCTGKVKLRLEEAAWLQRDPMEQIVHNLVLEKLWHWHTIYSTFFWWFIDRTFCVINYFYVQLYFFYHTIVDMDLFLGFNHYNIVFGFMGC